MERTCISRGGWHSRGPCKCLWRRKRTSRTIPVKRKSNSRCMVREMMKGIRANRSGGERMKKKLGITSPYKVAPRNSGRV